MTDFQSHKGLKFIPITSLVLICCFPVFLMFNYWHHLIVSNLQEFLFAASPEGRKERIEFKNAYAVLTVP